MKPRSKLLSALAAVGLLALAGAPAAAANCPGEDTPAAGQDTAALESTILCLVNERRAAAKRRPVRSNSLLRDAALGHSADMVRGGYFAHTSPSGVGFLDRIQDTGYTRRARNWVVGENLVWGSESLSSPAALVEAWMNSPPHRFNLLRKRFNEIGIGAVYGTPVDAKDAAGLTVSSEYGFKKKRKKGNRPLRRR